MILDNYTFKQKVLGAFILSSLFILLSGGLAFQYTRQVDAKFEAVIKKDAVIIENSRTLLKLVVDMESGQKGYLITGKEEFLEPYYKGKEKFPKLLEEQIRLVSEYPDQVEKLRDIKAKLQEWEDKAATPEIELAHNVARGEMTYQELEEQIAVGYGKKIIDEIRLQLRILRRNFELSGSLKGQLATADLLKEMLDRETGLRGFTLTGRESFLEPYYSGEKGFSDKFVDLYALCKGRNKEIATKVLQLSDRWSKKVALKQIESRKKLNESPNTLEDLKLVINEKTGKAILDELRQMFKEFLAIEKQKTEARYQDASKSSLISWIVIILVVVIAPIILVFTGVKLSDYVGDNMRKLNEVAKKVSKGERDIEIDIHSKDEIGELANEMQLMAHTIDVSHQKAENRTWLLTGINQLNEVLKGDHTIQSLASVIIKEVTSYLKLDAGVYFEANSKGVVPLSSRGVPLPQNENRELLRDGVLKDVLESKVYKLYDNLNAEFLTVKFSALEVSPSTVLFFPLVKDDKVLAVLELGFREHFEGHIQEYLVEVQNAIVTSIVTCYNRQKLQELAEETDRQAKGLNVQSKKLQTANDELKQLNYITSHNLKTPVTNIEALLSMLNLEGESSMNQELVGRINKSTQSMKETLKGLNEVIDVKEGYSIPVSNQSFSECYEKAIEGMSNEIDSTQAQLIVDFSKAKEVFFPEIHLVSIFQNLISNALKYKSNDRSPRIVVSSSLEDGYTLVKIKDNGLGIDLELMEGKLFGLYQRYHTKQEGTGVGLYLVKTTLENYDGKIEVKSQLGEGTTFYLYFANEEL